MDERTEKVLRRAYLKSFSLQSQFARDYSYEVAEAASRGLITTHIGNGHHGKLWRVSSAGLAYLELDKGKKRESSS